MLGFISGQRILFYWSVCLLLNNVYILPILYLANTFYSRGVWYFHLWSFCSNLLWKILKALETSSPVLLSQPQPTNQLSLKSSQCESARWLTLWWMAPYTRLFGKSFKSSFLSLWHLSWLQCYGSFFKPEASKSLPLRDVVNHKNHIFVSGTCHTKDHDIFCQITGQCHWPLARASENKLWLLFDRQAL